MNECLPNSCLLGVHLVISTHSGPQIVFHYPPSNTAFLTNNPTKHQHLYGNHDGPGKNETKEDKPFNYGATKTASQPAQNESIKNFNTTMTPSMTNANTNTGVLPSTRSHANTVGSQGSISTVINGAVHRETNAGNDSRIFQYPESESESSSSGLSDSELSTDYVDISSDSFSISSSLSSTSLSSSPSSSSSSSPLQDGLSRTNSSFQSIDSLSPTSLQMAVADDGTSASESYLDSVNNNKSRATSKKSQNFFHKLSTKKSTDSKAHSPIIKLKSKPSQGTNKSNNLLKNTSNEADRNTITGTHSLSSKKSTSSAGEHNQDFRNNSLNDTPAQSPHHYHHRYQHHHKTITNSQRNSSTQYDVEEDIEVSTMLQDGKISMNEIFFKEENFQDINKILEFDHDFVAEFCSPEREMCNTRFEFTVDNFCFLGLPIHVDSQGRWRKSKHKNKTRSKRSSSTTTNISRKKSIASKISSLSENTLKKVNSGEAETDYDNNTGDENCTDTPNLKVDTDFNRTEFEREKEDLGKNMNMFHVCFVMNPHLIEYNKRVDDMYQFVVTRLSLLLRYVQSKTSYTSSECHIILKEKERVLKHSKTYQSINGAGNKGKYLYQRILAKSSLARALTECVDKIQRNEIACLEIGDDKVISLQIPIQNEFEKMPNFKIQPVLRGSYVTSILNMKFLEKTSLRIEGQNRQNNQAQLSDTNNNLYRFSNNINSTANCGTSNVDDGDDNENGYYCDDNDDLLNYALLLLDEPNNIINSLETFSYQDDAGTMILKHLVRNIQPNIPLRSYRYLISELLDNSSSQDNLSLETNSLESSILRSCALHLMYWRHARIVIPLSSKYTYIVSPLAPIQGHTVDDFKSTSQNDEQVNTMGNGKNNVDQSDNIPLIYQNSILFRSKFPLLPALPIFLNLISADKPQAYNNIIPSREHRPIYLNALAWLIKFGYATQLLTFINIRVDKHIKMAVDEDLEKEGFRKSNNTSGRPGLDYKKTEKKPDDEDGQNRDANANEVCVAKTESEQSDDNNKNDNKDGNDTKNGDDGRDDGRDDDEIAIVDEEEILHFEYDDPEMQHDYTIILEPERATAIEKRWLFRCIYDQPSDIQILFNKLLKYFNGKVPMELVIIKEEISRHDLKKLLNALNKYLIETHHW
ncbi:rmd11p [Saccharomyces arboricola H-6]|uniref:Nitrogen permease regulator 3 n=1 Tax=Saccharomyces arboricola (strain H-6 / AS 2.3317 / CBS 10644) TaxID=1160507 RepID=J8Q1I2_SACAR|nr:rmd11p [Saccharomyces arboricola H-6]